MTLNTWLQSKTQKLRYWDISLVKISTAAFILMIAKLWNGILYLDWYWYLVSGLVLVSCDCVGINNSSFGMNIF